MQGVGSGFSREQCAQKAKEMNQRYFAIQYGSECYVSNDLNRTTSMGKTDCTSRDGQGREAGGGWANSVFDRTPQ